MSDFIHKVKEAVTGDKHDKHDKHDSHSAHNDSYDSNDANKPTPAYIVTASADIGTSTGASTGRGDGTGLTHAGSHDSSVTNKAGARVDNNFNQRRASDGVTGGNYSTGNNYSTGSNYGTGATTGAYNNSGYGTGTSSSNLTNKADSRLDSDRGNYGTTGMTSASAAGGSSHKYNTRSSTNNAGLYDSNLANKLDQRIDSNLDNNSSNSSSNRPLHQSFGGGDAPASSSYATPGSGNYTQKTKNAGLQDSKLLNKLDPRVDSEKLDNASRTAVGGGYDTRY